MTMSRAVPLLLLLAASGAQATQECKHSAPREATLDLTGIERVVIELGRHELDLLGTAGNPGVGTLTGRACATDPELLPHLDVRQFREGSTLRLRAEHVAESHTTFVFFGSHYEYLSLKVELPSNLPILLDVGSGDARVDGFDTLELDLGSGDVDIVRLAGKLTAEVGSGDLVVAEAGSLELSSLGSGDAVVRRLRGDAMVGRVGSGDLGLADLDGDVRIDSIGSGDVAVRNVGGNVRLDRLGSGDFVVRGVAGDLTVDRKGSGDIRHSDVRGRVSLPSR